MRVLLTGASGFIGRQITPVLLQHGAEVIRCVSKQGLGQPGNDRLQTVPIDLLESGSAKYLLETTRPSHVLHLAWGVPPHVSYDSPQNDLWRTATVLLAEEFFRQGGERFLGAGTCAEYSPVSVPRQEGVTPTEPLSAYGQAKIAACREVLNIGNSMGKSVAWGRIFYPFGPGDAVHRLIPSACTTLASGRPFSTKAGERVFDFVDVRDLAQKFVQLLLSDVTGPINLGGQVHQVGYVLREIERLCGKKGLLKFTSDFTEEPIIRADQSRWDINFGAFPHRSISASLQDCLALL